MGGGLTPDSPTNDHTISATQRPSRCSSVAAPVPLDERVKVSQVVPRRPAELDERQLTSMGKLLQSPRSDAQILRGLSERDKTTCSWESYSGPSEADDLGSRRNQAREFAVGLDDHQAPRIARRLYHVLVLYLLAAKLGPPYQKSRGGALSDETRDGSAEDDLVRTSRIRRQWRASASGACQRVRVHAVSRLRSRIHFLTVRNPRHAHEAPG
jgi:hypothetical protein